jgi:hypothetical protein
MKADTRDAFAVPEQPVRYDRLQDGLYSMCNALNAMRAGSLPALSRGVTLQRFEPGGSHSVIVNLCFDPKAPSK